MPVMRVCVCVCVCVHVYVYVNCEYLTIAFPLLSLEYQTSSLDLCTC